MSVMSLEQVTRHFRSWKSKGPRSCKTCSESENEMSCLLKRENTQTKKGLAIKF